MSDEKKSLMDSYQDPHTSTFTYNVNQGERSYGSITGMPVKSTTVKIKGGDKNASDSDLSDKSVSTHCHENVVRDYESNKKARKTLVIASIICLFFMIVEVVGGYLAGSLAIMTDAAHLLSDFAGFMISLVALYLATRPASRRMSFGWHRAEVIGAVISVLIIWVLTGVLVYMAVERIINKTYEIQAVIMLITSLVGVVVNIVMGIVLHRGGHGHSHGLGGSHSHGHSHGSGNKKDAHGHSHGKGHGHGHGHGHSHSEKPRAPIDGVYAQSKGQWIEIGTPVDDDENFKIQLADSHSECSDDFRHYDEDFHRSDKKWWQFWKKSSPRQKKDVNINVRAALVHVIGDFVQSVGIFIAALIIYFRPDLAIMDPICTFIFSVLVLFTTVTVIKDAINVLMEGLPRGMSFNEVAVALQSLHGVMKVHDLRIWSLTMDKVALSVHLAVEEKQNTQDILRQATQMLRERFRVYECTIQIEHYNTAMDDCKSCENPLQ